ncbi:MAG TPA: homoaconitate hydratase [Verrucomicrobiae bacterium]|jgi:isopropylmalate/homocitrate/citramalate synthase|nr:homoaconitate hydratase [Verrucomicrobiae bacterium]
MSNLAGKVWTSELNARPDVRPNFDRSRTIRFYDTTLRDGEQTVGVIFSPQQKLEIAKKLDELGVGRIEAGFPKVSAEDGEAISLILKAGLKHSEVWGFARATRGDVEELVRLGLQAAVIETPTSEIKLKAYGISREDAVRRVVDAVGYASQNGIRVAFFGVDGSRADLDFLRQIYSSAIEAGAQEIVLVDTIGVCTPEAAEFLVRWARQWAGKDIPIHWHGHNDFGLGTAIAIAAVRGGADWVQGTINGMGERAGNADIAEVALALQCLYDVPVELKLERIREVSEFVRQAGNYELEGWKPLIGDNLFLRESGAVASQFHIPEAIEPYAAELVGATRGIVLGKKSGLDSVRIKAEQLGIELPEPSRAQVLQAVKRTAIANGGLITDEEFAAIVHDAVGG